MNQRKEKSAVLIRSKAGHSGDVQEDNRCAWIKSDPQRTCSPHCSSHHDLPQ
jgi:hypothetical protein